MLEKELASRYTTLVNNFSFNEKRFCEGLHLDCKKAVAFSAIAAAWLRHLGTVDFSWTDARNQDSVGLGHTIAAQTAVWDLPDDIEVDEFPHINPLQVARQIGNSHRTLQQSFTRLCREWIRFVVEEWPVSLMLSDMLKYKKMFHEVFPAVERAILPFV